jgi:hypoxanthine-guanine phosphoribosyltransferase
MRALFAAAETTARVEALAMAIAGTIPSDFVMVGRLKGGALFVADLTHTLDRAGTRLDIEVHAARRLRRGQNSGGVVVLIGDVPAGLAGLPVLLDDTVDTGRSIA